MNKASGDVEDIGSWRQGKIERRRKKKSIEKCTYMREKEQEQRENGRVKERQRVREYKDIAEMREKKKKRE